MLDISSQLKTRSLPDQSNMADTTTGNNSNVCNLYGKAFVSRKKVEQHMFIHGHSISRSRPHKCKTCEKAFTQSGSLKTHLLTHSGDKSHKCGTCEKAFTQAGNLKTHLLIHSGEKSHKCGKCEKAFTQAGNLKRHLLTHSG